MKKHRLTLLLDFLLLALCPPAFAQEDNQILVFRHTGEVHLFYTHEVDSIIFSPYDRDSTFYGDYVSQVFFAKDTTLFVPIEEIDSVAFGNRNAVVFQPHARALSAQDVAYISTYDGSCIYYLGNTPSDLLPKPGDKLFYGETTELFPYALCAQVNSIVFNGTYHVASVSPVPLDEVFSQLFYAGTVSATPVTAKRSTHQITQTLPVSEQGSVSFVGNFQLDTRFVVSPLKPYYYAKIDVQTDLGFEASLSFTDVAPYHYESPEFLSVPFSPVLGVLFPSFSLQAFADINAELAFKYSMRRKNANQWEWKRIKGIDSFCVLGGTEAGPPTDEARIDVTCKGELFLGLQPVFEFSLPFETAGARAKVKIGPSFSGELGIGELASLEDYSYEAYAKGELGAALKIGLEGTAFNRNLITGTENETTVFRTESKFFERTIPLFPQFRDSRAVQVSHPGETALSVSCKTETPLNKDLEMGFEIIEPSGVPVDSVFSDQPIEAHRTDMQGFTTEIPLREAHKDKPLLMRPIFHYAGHTVRAEQTRVRNEILMQPVTAYTTNGANTFVSGWPYIGQARVDTTLYNIGTYLPVQVVDTVFSQPKPITAGVYLSPDLQGQLIGTWEGEVSGSNARYSFSEGGSGLYVPDTDATRIYAFQYVVNTPQTGDIQMTMDGNSQELKTITVVMIDGHQMRIKPKGVDTSYLLTKTE